MYNPFTKELYHGVKGGGAFLNGRRLAVSRTTVVEQAIVVRERERQSTLQRWWRRLSAGCWLEYPVGLSPRFRASLDGCQPTAEAKSLEVCGLPRPKAVGALVLRSSRHVRRCRLHEPAPPSSMASSMTIRV